MEITADNAVARRIVFQFFGVLLRSEALVAEASCRSVAARRSTGGHQRRIEPILARGFGLYVDADVYCWRPMEDADFIMGFEDNNDVNNAVMKLPVDSPVLADLCTIKEGWTPPWLTDVAVKPLPEYGWGVTGPRALTHYLQKHRIKYRAQPIDAFYPADRAISR